LGSVASDQTSINPRDLALQKRLARQSIMLPKGHELFNNIVPENS
jgi:hypothetical protein